MPGMHDLPPGFEFRPYVDGPGLYVDGAQVASASPARDELGSPWRVCIAPKGLPRFVFLPDEGACIRYMAGWARRWEVEIRRALVSIGSGNPYAVPGAARPPVEQQSKHPRHRSRRRSGL